MKDHRLNAQVKTCYCSPFILPHFPPFFKHHHIRGAVFGLNCGYGHVLFCYVFIHIKRVGDGGLSAVTYALCFLPAFGLFYSKKGGERLW